MTATVEARDHDEVPRREVVLAHQPALDGLRGLAVAGVLAFHAGFGWAVGGYLGVSAFFTLSGFLITTLLLAERDGKGRIDLRAFWTRRLRRLLPASLITLGAVAVLGPVLATPDQLATLRGDVIAALAYVANWRFVVEDRSYADLFTAPSPLLHFWSLAIEEQLYVVLPLLVAGIAAVTRRREATLAVVATVLLGASIVAGFVHHDPLGTGAISYYGTHTRAAELLVGVLLAVAVGRRMRRGAAAPPGGAAFSAAGGLALVAMVGAWTSVDQSWAWLHRGGLVVHALAVAVILTAAIGPGPVRTVLSVRPLRALGAISYGVYLYHWPLFLWMTPERVGLEGTPLVALQVLVTLVLAVASHRLVEEPIRRGRRITGWRPLAAVPVVSAAVVAAALLAGAQAPELEVFRDPPPVPDRPAPAAAPPPRADVPEAPDAADPHPTAEPEPLPRLAPFGDSTALRSVFAVRGWGWVTGAADTVDGMARTGCGLGRGGLVDLGDRRVPTRPECDAWPDLWGGIVRAARLDIAVVQVGPWDVTDRLLPGDDVWRGPGDPVYDDFLRGEIDLAVDVLSSEGAVVVWLTTPPIARPRPASDPARTDRLNELIDEVAERRDELVVVDVAGYLRGLGPDEDARLRPDGVHLTEEASGELVGWLGPAILDAARRVRDGG